MHPDIDLMKLVSCLSARFSEETRDVAHGVAYLHAERPPIVHGALTGVSKALTSAHHISSDVYIVKYPHFRQWEGSANWILVFTSM
jgi:hypothetical protein